MRAAVVEAIVANFEWAWCSGDGLARDGRGFSASTPGSTEQNQTAQTRIAARWIALAAEGGVCQCWNRRTARCLDLNERLRLDPELTFVTGVVTADSGTSLRAQWC